MRCIKSAYVNHGPDSREAANPWEFSRDGARIKNTLTLLPFLLPISASIPCTLCVLSHVQIFATPWTLACQPPLSMGFSRQEYWSGLHFLLQGIFPTQRSNLHLLCPLHCRWSLYPLSHREGPASITWVNPIRSQRTKEPISVVHSGQPPSTVHKIGWVRIRCARTAGRDPAQCRY